MLIGLYVLTLIIGWFLIHKHYSKNGKYSNTYPDALLLTVMLIPIFNTVMLIVELNLTPKSIKQFFKLDK